jgi:peptide/nickel transport system substrate-binding protein
MNREISYKRFFGISALVALGLMIAACGAQSSPPSANSAAPAATSASATEAPTPAVQSAKDVSDTQVVQSSPAAQGQLGNGTAVTSTEDVSTPRTHLGGEFRSSATSDFVSFQPYLTTDTASTGAQANVWEGSLLTLDEHTLQFKPYLAKSYEISPDGLTYTFHLHDTAKWSDGQPLTARDFQWTYDQVIKPENEFPYLSSLDVISSYVALDDYTLQVKLKDVYCPALTTVSAAISPLPEHIWKDLSWSDPQKNPEINNPTVTSGPYKLDEWKRDQYSTFTANPDYWYHGAPNITKLTTEIVPDSDVAYQKLKSGDVDEGVITPQNLEEARKLSNINVYEWWPAAATWSYIGLNMRTADKPTQDINVRHGLSYAVDKDVIVGDIMEGNAKRQCSVYPDTSWVYNPDVECYNYDSQKAIAEFEKSGYKYDKDSNTMMTPDGKPLELKLVYGPNTNKVREQIALSVQGNLADIGIKVDIQALEWASFLDAIQTKSDPDWDMFIGGWQSTIEPQFMEQIWSEQNIPDLNSVGYINKTVEQDFKDAGLNCATDYRKQKFGEIQKIISDESPYIFLYYGKAWDGLNKRVQGIVPAPLGIGYNSLDWYISDK